MTDHLSTIIARAQAGEHEAFSSLVEHCQDELRCFVAAHASSAELIEEVVQAAFVTCYERLHSYEPYGSFVSWLKGIALNHLRREARHRRQALRMEASVLECLAQAAMEESLAAATTDDEGTHGRTLQECLEGLPPRSRALLDGFYWQACSLKELARRFKKKADTLAVQLCRIRSNLRDCLRQKGLER